MIANMIADTNTTSLQYPAPNELYAGLADYLVSQLRALEFSRSYRAGTRLMACGEVPQDLMILTGGEAEILLPCSRHAISLGMVAPGKVFGLKALMTGEGTETDIVCVSPCTLTLLPGGRFLEMLRSHPEIYFMVAKILSSDLQQADKVLKHTSRRMRRSPRSKFVGEAESL